MLLVLEPRFSPPTLVLPTLPSSNNSLSVVEELLASSSAEMPSASMLFQRKSSDVSDLFSANASANAKAPMSLMTLKVRLSDVSDSVARRNLPSEMAPRSSMLS